MDGTCDGASIVSCGQWHTIVVASTTNEVYGWGWNKYGQLGPNINNDDDNDGDDHRNRHDDDDINLQSRKRRKQHSNMKCNNSNSRGGGGGDDGDGDGSSSSSSRSSHDYNYIHRDEVISHPRCLTNILRKSIHLYEKRCRIINHDDDDHHDNADDHHHYHDDNGEHSIEYSIDEVFSGSDYTAIVYNSSASTSSSIVIM